MTFYCCHHWYVHSFNSPNKGISGAVSPVPKSGSCRLEELLICSTRSQPLQCGELVESENICLFFGIKASQSQTPGSWLPFACSAHVLLQDCWSQIFKIQTLKEWFLISRHQHSYRPSAKTRMSHQENASLVHLLWVEQLTSGLLESSLPDVSPNP